MDDLDRAVLDLETRWYRQAGAKEAAARELGLGGTAYWQRLNRLLDDPAAAVEYPMVVTRLRRLREQGARRRTARRAS